MRFLFDLVCETETNKSSLEKTKAHYFFISVSKRIKFSLNNSLSKLKRKNILIALSVISWFPLILNNNSITIEEGGRTKK
jgi:hypothetical protein